MSKTAGYSGTPLHKKLGFKPGMTVGVIAAPEHYCVLLADAEEVSFSFKAGDGPFDAVHLFLPAPADIAAQSKDAIAKLNPGGMLWISWAKKSSKLHAGVTEDDLRTAVLPLGWVDVKVCAVDTDWSALKFLKRKS
ncbi:hypothetical protein [Yoonia sp. BS5-3]|uniref:DUF3052 domain-containing protein n=1 Tax=Yoonia phaeophyticola TaxID=3137369 RepID=A0ABZ2VBN8_9RHOB